MRNLIGSILRFLSDHIAPIHGLTVWSDVLDDVLVCTREPGHPGMCRDDWHDLYFQHIPADPDYPDALPAHTYGVGIGVL